MVELMRNSKKKSALSAAESSRSQSSLISSKHMRGRLASEKYMQETGGVNSIRYVAGICRLALRNFSVGVHGYTVVRRPWV